MKTDVYLHHDTAVHVQPHLKGRHREHCLCFSCALFTPDNRAFNCKIANELYALCVEHSVTTPVWECPHFVDKNPISSSEHEEP